MRPASPLRMFPPELRTASVVPRWSVVWTLNKDTVSNHSFYVTFYAHQIARMIGWEGPMADLMYVALVHDLDETITGDIVSPVKDRILDQVASDRYISDKMEERLFTVVRSMNQIKARTAEGWVHADIRAVVKAADRLDALLFLVTERRMGNGVIAPRIPLAWKNFEKAWFDLPQSPAVLQSLYENDIHAAVLEHTDMGGNGV